MTGWAPCIRPGTPNRISSPCTRGEFPVVELNFTYYQQPAARTLERMVAATPPASSSP